MDAWQPREGGVTVKVNAVRHECHLWSATCCNQAFENLCCSSWDTRAYVQEGIACPAQSFKLDSRPLNARPCPPLPGLTHLCLMLRDRGGELNHMRIFSSLFFGVWG